GALVAAAEEAGESTDCAIDRCRTATLALDYRGDTVANSLGDIVCCVAGYVLAGRLGFRGSVALFLVTEAVLLVWIRDDLLLNVVMLIHPVEAITAWQTGR